MKALKLLDARNKLKSFLDQFVKGAGYAIIFRRDADDAVAM